MYQNKLLKRFNEIFSGGQLQMFKGALKKSIDNQQITNHPIYGDMFISNLEILPLAKEFGYLEIKNPGLSDKDDFEFLGNVRPEE